MGMTQNQAIVLNLPNNDTSASDEEQEHIVKAFPKKRMLICAGLQICCGASVVLLQV